MSKLKTSSLFSILMLLSIAGNAQKLRIPLNSRAEDADFGKMMLISSVFQINNDSVSNPFDAASAKLNDPVQWRKITAPVMNSKMRRGFAWLNGGNNPDPFCAGQTLIVIENPGWTAYNTIIWTDRNHNFDLTDDGAPDTMTALKPAVIKLDDKPNGYKVQLEHFPYAKFPQYRQMHDDATYKLQGKRQFLGTENSFRERRLNVLSGSWSSASDSFSIAVKDVNCNGVYNDNHFDLIMMADRKGALQNLQGVVLENGEAYLEWNGVAYRIKMVDEDGQYIELIRDTTSKLRYSLNSGSKIPKFKFCKVGKPTKKKRINKIKSPYLYIYVWHDLAVNYITDSAALHALGRMDSTVVRTVALNYGNSANFIYRYNRRHDTRLIQGFSSNDINKKLMVRKIPHGILLDKKKRIIEDGISPKEVLQFLHSKQR
jgi:hypothetical protein